MRNLGLRNIWNRIANAGLSTLDPKPLATLNLNSCMLRKKTKICPSLNLQILIILHIYKELKWFRMAQSA
jgi:hypothetical protein